MRGQSQLAPVDTAPKRPRVFYGWYIVGAGSINSFVTMSIFLVGPAVFLKDIQNELAWSLAALSVGFSIRQLVSGMLAPLGGYLIDRVGPRVMAIAGTITMTLGLLLFSQMQSLSMFYLAAAVIALGQGMGAMNAFQTAVVHWFRRKRGRASAFLVMGRGLGYVGVIPITFLLVVFGWRDAAALSAVAFCAISLPSALVLRRSPEPYGYLPDGEPAPVEPRGASVQGAQVEEERSFTVGEALRSSSFWLMLVANFLYSFMQQTQHVHVILHMRHEGFSASGAAAVWAIYGVTQVVGRIASGWIGDKVGRHRLLMVSYLMMGLGWVAIAFLSPTALWTVALFYLTFGSGQAAQTVTAPTVVADFFGSRRYATIRGIMNPIGLMGGAIGPVLVGIMFDIYGSYHIAFLILGPVVALGSLAIFLAGTPTLAGDPTPTRQT